MALVLLLADRQAEVRPVAAAVDALAALRGEERHDVIARRERGHVRADALDDAGAFVAEHRRRVAGRIGARCRVEVGVADAAGGEPDEDLARARLREVDLLDDEWLPELLENRCPDAHAQSLAQPRTLRAVHLGVILPNYGARIVSGRDSACRFGRGGARLRLGLDDGAHRGRPGRAADPYRRVYDSLVTLGWIAGWTERIGLGTSIVIVPLHNPFHLAKQAATMQELSGGRLMLGVGMGWYEREYETMGVEFEGRGRRGDEAIRLMRALWSGERSFHGDHWSFDDPTSDPLPSPHPGDLGRRQLRAGDPPRARARRRLASVAGVERRPRPQREGAGTPSCAS